MGVIIIITVASITTNKLNNFLQVQTSQLLVLFPFNPWENLKVLCMVVMVSIRKPNRKSSNPSLFPDYSRWDQWPAFIIVYYYIIVDHLPFKNVLLSAKALK